MATSSKNHATSNLFNNQYRIRPTTVDQKRVLPRVTTAMTRKIDKSFTSRSLSMENQNKKTFKDKIVINKTNKEAINKYKNDSNESDEDNYAQSNINSFSNNDPEHLSEHLAKEESINELSNANENEYENDKGKSIFREGESNYSELDSEFDGDILNDDKWDTDIEEEGEKPKDFTCEGVYLDQCRKQKIIPVSYFLRHINDQVLTLKHHGLGEPGIRPVSAALMNNSLVTKLDLSDNWLGPKGADHLARMLKENCFISDLNLSENHLATQGCELLRDVLKQNNSLTHLTLQSNDFNDSTAPVWADIISNTIRIEYLDLSHNDFGEEAGRILGPALAENASIKEFNLSWNNIRRKGAVAIAKGLAANCGLKKFDISWNGLAQEGSKAFLKVLKENETLEELDLSNNRIATEGAVYIAKGLITNQTLRVIRLGINPMESPGCFSIIKALQKNPNTKLELIDFSEIIVDKFFKEEYKVFQTNFPNIKVLTGSDDVKLKPKIKIHPVVKLRNYIEKRQIKLIDFFNKFDKDGSLSVTRDEFREGLNELGINLMEDEIQVLLKDLDTDGDGEINYSEIAVGLTDILQ